MCFSTDAQTEIATRQRVLDAAGAVFAERGFRTATVRDICQRAGANVAAVNYHFGDKAGLYAAVLRYAHRCSLEKYPPDFGLGANATVAQRLHAFIHAFLLRIFDDGQAAWFGKLMAREMIEPTRALDTLVQEEIRPRAEQLAAIVRALLGPDASDELVRLSATSIIGQCVFYYNERPLLLRLFPAQQYTAHDIARLARHITQFSLGALQHVARHQEGDLR